jgi:predicted transcriptional regulator
MKYRDRIDIISSVLEVANVGDDTTKTRIMYNANLSHDQLKEYLTVLTERDLLSYDLDSHTFKTTEKGLRFLEIYNRMDGMTRA